MDDYIPLGSNEPQNFSWQYPAQVRSLSDRRRAQLNDELSMNEQRHFGQPIDEFFDAPEVMPPPVEPTWEPPPGYQSVQQQNSGYMHQPSAFTFDSSAGIGSGSAELSFFDWYPSGNGTLSFQNDDNEVESIRYVNLHIVEERCPVLAMAFEDSRSGPQLYLETLTSSTALPFLRFLYSGTYALKGASEDFYEDVPTSVLFHCQLFRLGDIYDLPELKSQAYVNVLRQCEFGCSSPDKPIDLCAAIRYMYEHLQQHDNLKDAIINYCVSCFLRHQLAKDEEFKKLAYDLRPFHQALCRNSMDRQFENETAAAIIQMPYKPYIPDTYKSREDFTSKRFDDVVYHFHSNDDWDTSSKKRKRAVPQDPPENGSKSTLPLRPYDASSSSVAETPTTEEKTLTFRHKRQASALERSNKLAEIIRCGIPPLHTGASTGVTDGSESEEEYVKVNESNLPNEGNISSEVHQESLSDDEFEFVDVPLQAPAALRTDSQSNVNMTVDDEQPELQAIQRPATTAAADITAVESDSESDWSLMEDMLENQEQQHLL